MKKFKKIIISIVIIGGGIGLYFYLSTSPETDTIPETKDSTIADSVVPELSPVLTDTTKKDTVKK